MRKNYVLIDLENVQPTSVEHLDQECIHVVLFAGPTQTSVRMDLFESILNKLRSTSQIQLVRVSHAGKNSLDFHLAYELGVMSEKDPSGYFHIISKDKGYDPLVKNLRERKIYASRHAALSDIPIIKLVQAKTTEERIPLLEDYLTKQQAARPRKMDTLRNTLNHIFRNQLEKSDRDQLIKHLMTSGKIVVSDQKITYHLPSQKGEA